MVWRKQLSFSAIKSRVAFDSGWQSTGLILTAVLLGFLLSRLPLPVAGVLAAGTAVFLLTLIQPLFGLGITLLAGPFGALENQVFGVAALDSGQMLLLFTFAAWVSRGLLRKKIVIPQTTLNLPFLILIFSMILTLPGAVSPLDSFKEILKWIEMLLIMWMIVDLAQEFSNRLRQVIGWLVAMLLLAGVIQAVIGVWQFGLRGDGPEHFLVLGQFYRAYGTFEQPNPFGGFMNLSALLAIGLLIGCLTAWRQAQRRNHVRLKHNEIKIWQWFFVTTAVALAALITTLGVVVSWSRGAWLGFAAGTAVLLLLWPRKQRWGWILLAAVLALFIVGLGLNLIPDAITSRLAGFTADLQFGDIRGVDINDANYSVLERLAHWQAALDMATQKLWLGVGIGNYGAAYPDFALINWPDALGHAHNYYLNILAEAGVIGLLAYAAFWLVVFRQTWRLLGTWQKVIKNKNHEKAANSSRKPQISNSSYFQEFSVAYQNLLDWPERGIALGLMGAWTALTVHQLVDKLYVNNIYIHLGAMLGLLQLLAIVSKR